MNLSYSGDATNGEDFMQLPGTVTFRAGELVTYLEVFPIDDGDVEGDETLIVTVEDGSYDVNDPNSVTAVIIDNDVEITTISGTITYTGTESGSIVVEAFRDDDAPHQKVTQQLTNPGPYELTVEGGSYTVVAFVDENDDGAINENELWGIYQGPDFEPLKVDVPPSAANIDINLDVAPGEPPPDGDGDGCCATYRPTANGSWILGLIAVVWAIRRRRIF